MTARMNVYASDIPSLKRACLLRDMPYRVTFLLSTHRPSPLSVVTLE